MQNNCHSARGNNKLKDLSHHHHPSQAPSPCGTLVDVKLQRAADGHGAFHQMKIVRATPLPREAIPTSEEKLAAKLSHAMASGLNGLLLSHDILHRMAGRLSESTALSDALTCLLATFANLKRALPFQDLIDLQTYGKALKSLQKALKDPNQQYTTLTLAAVTILYQIEVAYDSSKGPNKALHCNAIYDLMSTRGPPSLDDMLDVHLAFENAQSMLSYTLLTNSPNFYTTTPWLWTLQTALDSGLITSPAHVSLYTLHTTLSSWPSLASTLRTLHSDPLNPFAPELAMDLLTAANTLSFSLQTYDETVINSLYTSGDIYYTNADLDFSSLPIAQLYATHAMASLATTSIIHSTSLFLGLDTTLQPPDWTSRIRRSRPYATRQGPGGVFLVPGLIIAYDVEGDEGRKEVLDALRDLDGWKYPRDNGQKKGQVRSGWNEKAVLEMGVVLCGRGMFGVEGGEGREFW